MYEWMNVQNCLSLVGKYLLISLSMQANSTSGNSGLSDTERREKKALEKKLTEMEEELKVEYPSLS